MALTGWWTADLGCWDRGRNVELPGVSNVKEAIQLAQKILKEGDWSDCVDGAPYVVQIYDDKGRVVWDFFSGAGNYQ